MPISLNVEFVSLEHVIPASSVLFVDESVELGQVGQKLDRDSGGHLTRAMKRAQFRGKARSALELVAPAGKSNLKKLTLVGAGDVGALSEQDWVTLGGYAFGQLGEFAGQHVGLIVEPAVTDEDVGLAAAQLALGALLRSYRFDTYKTAKKDEGDCGGAKSDGDRPQKLSILTTDPAAATEAYKQAKAIADGVAFARDLVNEPANMLGPVEFAHRCAELERVGVAVDILDDKRLRDIGMYALLAVAQGSARPARVAIMSWSGARSKRAKPWCFVGKGVCFDTGGISMKPAAGMEDMKGDMGGAACVAGLMHALAAREAPINAVGLVGLVENMPSATAQRPGDIVSSLSAQTIEVLNTDAEGRMVLADLLTYAEREYEPRAIIDLATLTGAIIVALGKDHAGLFSNDDRLAADLIGCGVDVDEKVWRMPMGRAYDKMIDSRNADMKNIGGRSAGAITAAQFLLRFVKKTPWVHLDVAGTAMASEKTEISRSWASGWGVRLLDRLVTDKTQRK
ncbi:MAG: leucyl aminopeptidase [Hyphomicrobiaceae bacterium]